VGAGDKLDLEEQKMVQKQSKNENAKMHFFLDDLWGGR